MRLALYKINLIAMAFPIIINSVHKYVRPFIAETYSPPLTIATLKKKKKKMKMKKKKKKKKRKAFYICLFLLL